MVEPVSFQSGPDGDTRVMLLRCCTLSVTGHHWTKQAHSRNNEKYTNLH